MFGVEKRNKGVTLLAVQSGRTKGHISQVLSGKRKAKSELAEILQQHGYTIHKGFVKRRTA